MVLRKVMGVAVVFVAAAADDDDGGDAGERHNMLTHILLVLTNIC